MSDSCLDALQTKPSKNTAVFSFLFLFRLNAGGERGGEKGPGRREEIRINKIDREGQGGRDKEREYDGLDNRVRQFNELFMFHSCLDMLRTKGKSIVVFFSFL